VYLRPWLRVKPNPVVIGELAHKREEGVIEMWRKGRTLSQAFIEVVKVG
jgi:hypothetical protein